MKMRSLAIFALLMALTYAIPLEEPGFEDLNINSLLQDEGKAKLAFDCMMDRGPCGEFQKLRDTVPEMVETQCSRCTIKQKEKYDEVSHLLFEKHPKEFKALAEKYSSQSE